MEQDPIGYAAGDANLYGYESDGPTDSVDPYGLLDPLGIPPAGPRVPPTGIGTGVRGGLWGILIIELVVAADLVDQLGDETARLIKEKIEGSRLEARRRALEQARKLRPRPDPAPPKKDCPPKDGDDDNNPKCQPCIPPVGTIAYRMDLVPPTRPHKGFPGHHVHLYVMQQSPPDRGCKCFWHPIGVQAPPPPPGTIPIVDAGGGGIA